MIAAVNPTSASSRSGTPAPRSDSASSPPATSLTIGATVLDEGGGSRMPSFLSRFVGIGGLPNLCARSWRRGHPACGRTSSRDAAVQRLGLSLTYETGLPNDVLVASRSRSLAFGESPTTCSTCWVFGCAPDQSVSDAGSTPRTFAMASTVTGPCRSTRGWAPVRSTIVDAACCSEGPPSRYTSTRSPS